MSQAPRRPGARASCLAWFSGRFGLVPANELSKLNPVRRAALARKRALILAPRETAALAILELASLMRRNPASIILARFDGGTDLGWGLHLAKRARSFSAFNAVRWYDYTKDAKRAQTHARTSPVPNYRLAFSHTDNNPAPDLTPGMRANAYGDRYPGNGVAVAVVTPNGAEDRKIPGRMLFDGDEHGERWALLSPSQLEGLTIALRFKASRGRKRALALADLVVASSWTSTRKRARHLTLPVASSPRFPSRSALLPSHPA